MTDKRVYGAWDCQIYKGLQGPETLSFRIGETWASMTMTEWSRLIAYPINAEIKNGTDKQGA